MIIEVDSSSAIPVYEQIRAQVTRMAASGVLSEGTRLPTIRQLANDLGLAKGTVAKAYSLLESHKVVRSSGPRGTFVEALPDSHAADRAEELREAAESYVVAARQLGVDLPTAIENLQTEWDALP